MVVDYSEKALQSHHIGIEIVERKKKGVYYGDLQSHHIGIEIGAMGKPVYITS